MAIARISFSDKSLNFSSMDLDPKLKGAERIAQTEARSHPLTTSQHTLAFLTGFGGSPKLLAPVVEEGNACQNHGQSQGRAHWAHHPQVDGESDGGGQKEERRPGMSQSAVRPGQVRFFAAQAKQGNCG